MCPPQFSTMSAKSAISKEIFAPLDERMLGAVQVKRRTKKKIPFLATGGQGEYLTYICLSGNENQTLILLKQLHLKHTILRCPRGSYTQLLYTSALPLPFPASLLSSPVLIY